MKGKGNGNKVQWCCKYFFSQEYRQLIQQFFNAGLKMDLQTPYYFQIFFCLSVYTYPKGNLIANLKPFYCQLITDKQLLYYSFLYGKKDVSLVHFQVIHVINVKHFLMK